MFDPVDPKQRLPELEEGILRYWSEEDTFKRSLKQRSTGTGDLLAGTIKDVIPRYQTMRGKYVERRFGWDCHGLPVENIIEQEKGIKSHKEIEEMGIAAFNGLCRTAVQRYAKEWRTVVERMGRWVDMDWDYLAVDPHIKYVKYQYGCERYILAKKIFDQRKDPKNLLHPLLYAKAKREGEEIEENPESVEDISIKTLLGKRYIPLFPYFQNQKEYANAYRIVGADFVTADEGTGIVHIAPGFGEDDYNLGKKEKLPVLQHVNMEGKFVSEVTDFAGMEVKPIADPGKTDRLVTKWLKEHGKLFDAKPYTHSYPHCWRCDSPLLNYATSSWFVSVEKIKEDVLAANAETEWVPAHIRDGRFGKWLEGARDWAISRNRYWGTPLPIWRSKDGQEVICVGSIKELEQLSGQKVSDLHKHNVDKLEIPSKNGKENLRRIPEVLDCWFESGAMPYAQAHYPFENKEHFESHFPADFIAEGLDQTRGWFYRLMVLSVSLFDKPAFKNVIVNGLVLAEDGKKMSKRLKNYPDPVHVVNNYGADALRLYLINSPVVRTEDLCFSEEGVKQVLRDVLIPLWNAYSFFVTYANIDGWHGDGKSHVSTNVLDRWIRSSLESLAAKVTSAMDNYDLQ